MGPTLLTATFSQFLISKSHDQSTFHVPKVGTYLFQTLQPSHHTVDGGFRHAADLSQRENHHLLVTAVLEKLSEYSPFPQRYGPSAAGARNHDRSQPGGSPVVAAAAAPLARVAPGRRAVLRACWELVRLHSGLGPWGATLGSAATGRG